MNEVQATVQDNAPYIFISFVETLGNMVVRAGTIMAQQLTDIEHSQPNTVIRETTSEMAQRPLPAYWDTTKGVVSLTAAPSPTHYFDYDALQWIPDVSEAWRLVRKKRDSLLAAIDWRATRSVVEKRRLHPVWAAYQQALRDITLQPDPANITWPEPPTAPTFADQDPDQYPVLEDNAKFELFTDAERAAILTTASTDTAVMLLVNRITGAAFITYADPELEFGLTLLVNKELLTPERKAEIVVSLLPPSMQSV